MICLSRVFCSGLKKITSIEFSAENLSLKISTHMSAELLLGKVAAKDWLEQDLIPRVKKLQSRGIEPLLVVVLVGSHPASLSYIKQKETMAAQAGLLSRVLKLPEGTSQTEIIAAIEELNQDPAVHGIIVQLPLPEGIAVEEITAAIDSKKDVDGFSAENMGRLTRGAQGLQSCTPAGIMRLLSFYKIPLQGAHIVVAGRSNIVGKPVALLALGADATVSIIHSRTKNSAEILKQADIIIAAVGILHWLQPEWVRAGATVVDVGIHRQADGTLGGDVAPEVAQVAHWLSPVPGGVGPMTVMSLLANTVQAAEDSVAGGE